MRHRRLFTSALTWIGVLALLGGCSPPSEDLEILCGNSFRDPMEELARRYEKQTGHHVEMSFGGSEDLLPKVKLKATGDVFVTHDPFVQYTKQAEALLREVPVGFLAPVLVVRKGNPQQVERFEDLARTGLRVVLPDPEYSTCGQMVYKLLEKKQLKDAVLKNVEDHLVRDHAQVGNQLKLNARDAGIMWNGVAANYPDAIEIVPGPYEYEEIRVTVMGLSYSRRQERLKEFLDFVEEHGKQVFAEFGYVKAEGNIE